MPAASAPLAARPPAADRLAPFRLVISVVRLATIGAAIVLVADPISRGQWWIAGWVAAVVVYDAARIVHPLRDRGDRNDTLVLYGELSFHLVAVLLTGRWASPAAFPLLTTVMVLGLARDIGAGLRSAAAAAILVGAGTVAFDLPDASTGRFVLQWTLEILLVAFVAGYARRISGEATRQHSVALDRLGQLTDANDLLYALHRLAQSLPASLDLDETLDDTMGRLQELFGAEVTAVLLLDDTDGHWVVARTSRPDLAASFAGTDLPLMLHRAVLTKRVVRVADLHNRGRGLALRSRSGLYAPLVARQAVVGLIALEHGVPQEVPERQVELLEGLSPSMALAIDNARWFERLRTIGAEEERTRIARDLHDRIGQSLAYLAFELDRIIKSQARGSDVAPSLVQLRGDLRGVIGEVRDTLYDLRTDVSAQADLGATLRRYLDRVADRSGLQVDVEATGTGRLPLSQERELWRIAQEAVTNVERHARAGSLRVRWHCDGSDAALEVCDDGIGFPPGRSGRLDSYGILGMRERAASIGASLDVSSEVGGGTVVRCELRA